MKPDYKRTRRVIFEELVGTNVRGSRKPFYKPEMPRQQWDYSAPSMHRTSLVA